MAIGLVLIALAFRLAVAHWLPNDAPDDGRIYAQIGRNLLEQHVFSHEAEAPYDPSFIRLPGYPLFLAGIYAIFGHTNNGAVRIAQALIDTATCVLIAWLAFCWQPDQKRKRVTAVAALTLSAACPFTAIYSVAILTEVPTNFFVVAMCLAATIALRKMFTVKDAHSEKDRGGFRNSARWWCVAGLLGGITVMFRPDCGLFVAAIGLALVIATIWSAAARRRFALPVHSKLVRMLVAGSAFSLFFVLALTPWTIRNWRVFHLFQPLSPVNAEMPGDFIPHGYLRWVKTWLTDQRYIDVAIWEVGIQPITIDDLPASAFDSDLERDRVAALLDQYNHPPPRELSNNPAPSIDTKGSVAPTPANPLPSASKATPAASPAPDPDHNSNANTKAGEADKSDEEDDNSDENDNQTDESQPEKHGPVAITPEIDAAFGQIAAERIARHPLRYYLVIPAKRAVSLWFNTHSDYYPFEGPLFPLEDLDHDIKQHIWLPLFAALVGIYTIAGLVGAFILWWSGNFWARIWVVLAFLIVFTRLAFFSTLENPEPRYVVEFFPFLSALGGIALARIWPRSG